MPTSRHRKKEVARKKPRVPHSNPSGAASETPTNQKRLVFVIVVLAVLVLSGVLYVITRRGSQAGGEIITTASGLKYQDIKVGDGASPTLGQTVTAHYIGRFENGKEFNNSYNLGKPVNFTLGKGLIEGWNEGLQTMKVGGKRRLWIPSNLAYGPAGKPPAIPPNSNLEFDIELLGIK
ncbi:MAG TPA: FKBP-type peptidyl-prolyl cis-trans isomerase [Pyrinomonadaceae bacterium]|nr:FKBP-type peptidyl-prolyl cis-trans isomerase [Pyrinomonadaceae bacterium]